MIRKINEYNFNYHSENTEIAIIRNHFLYHNLIYFLIISSPIENMIPSKTSTLNNKLAIREHFTERQRVI
jgi:hypothetical protein